MNPTAVGVVVPAHDEAAEIGGCLDALAVATRHPSLAGVPVELRVVLDDCADGTEAVCRRYGATVVRCRDRNVGRARARGVVSLLADLVVRPGADLRGLWVASTDADSRVAPDWLAEQVRLAVAGADAVLGVVDIEAPTAAFRALYRHASGPGPHPHVHGANMGMSLVAYLRAGGFAPASVGEDVALADRLGRIDGLQIARSTTVRVTTSARRTSRVRGGFADVLRALDLREEVPRAVQA